MHRRAPDTHLSPCRAVQMEDVTQGPASHVASLQQEPPQCGSVWWSDGRERDVERPERSEDMELETQGGAVELS